MYSYYDSYWERLMNKRMDWERKKYCRYILSAMNGGYYIVRREYHVLVVCCYASIPMIADNYKPP